MSQFGADIFDDEPPTKPPKRKGRKSSPTKADEPVAREPQPAPAAEPKKRPSRRKKAAVDSPGPSMQVPQAIEETVIGDTSVDRAKPSGPQPTASVPANDPPKQKSRGRGRRAKQADVAAQDRVEAPQQPDLRRPQLQPEPQAPESQRSEPPPSVPEFDDEGEGFGALPGEEGPGEEGPGEEGPVEEGMSGDESDPNRAGAVRDGDNFPRFGDDRRGRRRRRRRGRRGNRDGGPSDHPAHGQELDANAFLRDPRGDAQNPPSEHGGFPHDPSSPAADRPAERRDDRGRHQQSRHGQGRHGHGRDDAGRRDRGRGDTGRDFEHEEDPQPRVQRRPYTDFKPATPPPPSPQPRRIALLVDLAQLSEQAKSRGGEIAYRKLRAAIAGHDEVVHAVCFATRDLPETGRSVLKSQGFTIEDCADADGCADAMAEEAARAQWPVDALVVVGSRALARLPQAAGGAAVETAGFDGTGGTSPLDRCLPSNCLFVP